MPIDWFTVVAQILNFIVLIWILKRFLYQPVLRTMEERQEAVRRSITDAAEEKQRATGERKVLEEERCRVMGQRDEELRRAREEAQRERSRLIGEARVEFEDSRSRWRAALQREQAEFQQELSAHARTEVIEIADRLLSDLADVDLQDRILHKFLTLLQLLGDDERERLRSSIQAAPTRSATVRSAFELSAERRATLQGAINQLLGDGVATDFEIKPALGCGIELSVDGQKIAWSIQDYLHSLDACMHELVASQTRQHEGTVKVAATAGQ